MTTVSRKKNGFSLIEMAVVMLIMGSLLSGLLVALTQTSDSTRRTTAKNQLIKIEEALYAFAQVNGRLPCPATSASGGYESFDAVPNEDECEQQHGFVPSASLSLYSRVSEEGLMLDPWANPYRYSIAFYEVDGDGAYNLGTGVYGFTTISSADIFNGVFENFASDVDTAITDQSLLQICDVNNCTGEIFSGIAPAVVFSMGKNWTEMIADCGVVTNTDEVENAGAVTDDEYCLTDTNVFVDAEYNENSFDDIIIWLSPYVLFSRMIDAAQLP